MRLGHLVLVLHSHIPYVRRAGAWPFGEEVLFEAMAETYLPLLDLLYDLLAAGIHPKVTIGLTPILVEQLGDAGILGRFEQYLTEKRRAAGHDRARFAFQHAAELERLAAWYEDWYGRSLDGFRNRYCRELPAAFRALQDAGAIEVLTSAATHAYLPLLERRSALYAQLATGVASYRRVFGRPPRGVWLPECGYRPGVERLVGQNGLDYFFTDGHVLGGTGPDQAIVGPYPGVVAPRFVATAQPRPAVSGRSVFEPYWVGRSRVAVFAREQATGRQVWSATEGYPGDFAYREFHKRDDVSGLQYWRISDGAGDLAAKRPYQPAAAAARAAEHAAHFVGLLEHRLAAARRNGDVPPVLVAAYDTELFGHWWFEGITWLGLVLRQLAEQDRIEPLTATEALAASPPTEPIDLPESSWGAGGGHATWLNEETAWLWPQVHEVERRLEALVERYPEPPGG